MLSPANFFQILCSPPGGGVGGGRGERRRSRALCRPDAGISTEDGWRLLFARDGESSSYSADLEELQALYSLTKKMIRRRRIERREIRGSRTE